MGRGGVAIAFQEVAARPDPRRRQQVMITFSSFPQNLSKSPQNWSSAAPQLKPTPPNRTAPTGVTTRCPTMGRGAPPASRPPPHTPKLGKNTAEKGSGLGGGTPGCPGGPKLPPISPQIPPSSPPGPGFLFLRERRCLRFCFSPSGHKETAKKKQKAPVVALPVGRGSNPRGAAAGRALRSYRDMEGVSRHTEGVVAQRFCRIKIVS